MRGEAPKEPISMAYYCQVVAKQGCCLILARVISSCLKLKVRRYSTKKLTVVVGSCESICVFGKGHRHKFS